MFLTYTVKPAQCLVLLAQSESGFFNSSGYQLDALVVGLAVHGVGDAVFAAVGEGVAGGVAVAGGNSVDELGDKAQRPQCLGTDA